MVFHSLRSCFFWFALVGVLPAPLTYTTNERTDLFGRDVASASPSQKKEMWVDKMTEFCQVINGGSTDAAPTIPLQVIALLDNSGKTGYYKVTTE